MNFNFKYVRIFFNEIKSKQQMLIKIKFEIMYFYYQY